MSAFILEALGENSFLGVLQFLDAALISWRLSLQCCTYANVVTSCDYPVPTSVMRIISPSQDAQFNHLCKISLAMQRYILSGTMNENVDIF